MTRTEIARNMAARLFETEDAIDGALKQTVRLIEAMIDARRDLNLAATVGEDVVQRSSAAVSALAEAREEMVRVHQALATTRDKLGMRTLALGALDKPDDPHTLALGNEAEIRR